MQRLCAGEPRLCGGTAYFYDLVQELISKIIPRPETELLVETVLDSAITTLDAPRIIDVGTGRVVLPLR